MTHASLCTGIGACELAATWMGWENLFSCEIDEFCNKVLKYHYPNSVHYGNIFEQDFREWRGRIDILTAGFPCQPFSVAGARNGAEDDRYLWPEVLRVIEEIRTTWFVGENVGGIITMVLPGEETKVGSYTDVCGENYTFYEKRQRFVIEQIRIDLASIGYSVQPVVIPACAVGAPHRRDRVWLLARRDDVTDTDGAGLQETGTQQRATGVAGDGIQRASSNTQCHGREKICNNLQPEQSDGTIVDCISGERYDRRCIKIPDWQNFPATEPAIRRGDDGDALGLSGITFSRWRQESIKALGNSMVPQVVHEIFKAIEQVEETLN